MSDNLPELPKKSPVDHVVNSIKAICATIPGGGGIATLIDDYIPKSTEKALYVFVSELKDRIAGLENRVEIGSMDEDEFAELFKSCYVGVIKTTQEEKLKVFAAIFANIMLKQGDPDKAPYSELDHIVRAMDSLSIGALHVMVEVYRRCSNNRRSRTDFANISSSFSDMPPSLLMGLVTELNSQHLVQITVPTVRLENYANYALELTDLGRNFVERYASPIG